MSSDSNGANDRSGVLENFGDLWRAQEKLYSFSGVRLPWPVPEAAVMYGGLAAALLVFGPGLPVIGGWIGIVPLLARLGLAIAVGFAGAVYRPDGRALHYWTLGRARMLLEGRRLVAYRRARLPSYLHYGDLPVLSDGREVRLRSGRVRAHSQPVIVRFPYKMTSPKRHGKEIHIARAQGRRRRKRSRLQLAPGEVLVVKDARRHGK